MKILLLTTLTLSSMYTFADSTDMRSDFLIRQQYKASLEEKVSLAESKLESIYEQMEALCEKNEACDGTQEYAKLSAAADKEELSVYTNNKILSSLK